MALPAYLNSEDGSPAGSARTSAPLVLVIDADPATLAFVNTIDGLHEHDLAAEVSADAALRRCSAQVPSAVILDVDTSSTFGGHRVLHALKRLDRNLPVIVLSAHGITPTVMQAMKLGATCFVAKPLEGAELGMQLTLALAHRLSTRTLDLLRKQFELNVTAPLLFSGSKRMAAVASLIEHVADTDVPVLIRGESGTGKELVARTLVSRSARRDKPFVKVNCAATPPDHLEAELFGFERGTFSSAVQHKPGKFEFANQGTLFLDGIGRISLPLQARLMHVLQDGVFSRLGGSHDVRVDVRVIAATSRDLERAVDEGDFRKDLFFRLNVITITLPPLRERREDIPLLVDHFLRKYSAQYNRRLAPVSPEAQRLFMDHVWPGNVRELEQLIKRTVVLGSDTAITGELAHTIALAREHPRRPVASASAPASLETVPSAPEPWALSAPAPEAETDSYALKQISRQAAHRAERELISRVLQRTQWNRKAAAVILRISYKALLYKIKECGLDDAYKP